MAAFGIGIKGISQKGDYCNFKTTPKAYEISYTISYAEYVKELDYAVSDSNSDFHYKNYKEEKIDVPMIFFKLTKKYDLKKIRRIEFENGINIIGSGHTGRIDLGEITKFNILENVLKIEKY